MDAYDLRARADELCAEAEMIWHRAKMASPHWSHEMDETEAASANQKWAVAAELRRLADG